MAAMELSLDDIIKKNLVQTSLPRGRNIGRKHTLTSKETNQLSRKPKSPGTNFNRPRFNNNPRNKLGIQRNVADARFKIIQKKRQKITDAREKLGEIAKQTDARFRIERLRQGRFDPIAARFLVQHPRSLNKPESDRIITGQGPNMGISPLYREPVEDMDYEEHGYGRGFPDPVVDLYEPQTRIRVGQNHSLYQTVENELARSSRMFVNNQRPALRKTTSSVIDEDEDDVMILPLKRTMYADVSRRDPEDSGYVLTKSFKKPGILKMSGNATERNMLTVIRESSPPTIKTVKTLNERFCQDSNLPDKKISEKISKLSSAQKNIKSEPAEVGHRIVVSNLVSSVTHRDVKELFGDIGKLIYSKVVRPGTAEVVYKSREDAVKAVSVYHDRHLDGQPMKCFLVNNPATVSAIASRTGVKKGKSNVELDINAIRKALHKKSSL